MVTGWALAPHDVRRTFAKLAHKGRAPLEQIQIALGHASIQTTERYLRVQQDLTDAPCDHLGIRVQGASKRRQNCPLRSPIFKDNSLPGFQDRSQAMRVQEVDTSSGPPPEREGRL